LIGFCGLAIVFLYVGIPFIYGRCLRAIIRNRVLRSRAVIITFDDGPGNRLTPAILDLLAEYDVKASFFLTGCCIAGKESIVKRIADEGHEICSHGYGHLHHWKVSPFRSLSDIKRGWQAIDAALGTQEGVYPFRPPYGRLNLVSMLYLWLKKVPIIFWTIDSGDTWPHEKRDIQRASVVARNAGGSLILAHDNDRVNPDTEAFVLASLNATLAMTEENGMQVFSVSELLAANLSRQRWI